MKKKVKRVRRTLAKRLADAPKIAAAVGPGYVCHYGWDGKTERSADGLVATLLPWTAPNYGPAKLLLSPSAANDLAHELLGLGKQEQPKPNRFAIFDSILSRVGINAGGAGGVRSKNAADVTAASMQNIIRA